VGLVAVPEPGISGAGLRRIDDFFLINPKLSEKFWQRWASLLASGSAKLLMGWKEKSPGELVLGGI
jgi:hypothetical protein